MSQPRRAARKTDRPRASRLHLGVKNTPPCQAQSQSQSIYVVEAARLESRAFLNLPEPPRVLLALGQAGARRSKRMSVEVVLLRHAERVDETAERGEWARNCGDRYWDPPITQQGLRQSRDAGEALLLEHARRPFSCIYVSPCLRTVQTAAELAQVLGLPLRCAPGLAECAAFVARKGIASFRPTASAANGGGCGCGRGAGAGAGAAEPPSRASRPPPRFLTEAELAVHCREGTRFLDRDHTYEGFFACVARIAAAERDARICGAALETASAASGLESATAAAAAASAAASPSARVLMVTHREGIRDLCTLAGAPHRRTPYCCAALYALDATPAAAGGGGGSTWAPAWRLLSPPSERPGRLGPSPCTTDAGPAPSGIAPAHDSTDVLLAELDAGRLAAEEFARLGRAAGMPEAAVTEVLRSLVCASK